MQALIVLSHPEPQSFNGALTEVAVGTLKRLGHSVQVSDLYAERFDPAEGPGHYRTRRDSDSFAALAEQRHASEADGLPDDVRREIARLARADLVIFQFPLWWHGPPAMLKGWFDRVFVNGGLYSSTRRYERGAFRGRRALLSVTTGAPATAFGPGARGGDMAQLLWPVHYSLHYMGFSVLPPQVAFGVQGHGFAYQAEDRFKQHLTAQSDTWAQRLAHIEHDRPLSFPGWDDWDEAGRPVSRASRGQSTPCRRDPAPV